MFLRDDATAAIAATSLSRAFVPEAVSSATHFCLEEHTPTETQRERVSKVCQAFPNIFRLCAATSRFLLDHAALFSSCSQPFSNQRAQFDSTSHTPWHKCVKQTDRAVLTVILPFSRICESAHASCHMYSPALRCRLVATIVRDTHAHSWIL